MNREIKFRIWDKKYNCFTSTPDYPGVSLHCIPNYFLSENGELQNLISTGNDEFYTKEKSVHDNFVIQQYTGVKDKTGKEIYEGDFLKDFEFPVFFRDGCFFVAIMYDLTEAALYELDKTELEVIGNIFQNPELKYE